MRLHSAHKQIADSRYGHILHVFFLQIVFAFVSSTPKLHSMLFSFPG